MRSVVENKFLESIVEFSNDLEATFLLANAGISHHPIIYCSKGFAEETGFTRNEVCQKNIFLDFLFGRQTSDLAKIEYEDIIRAAKQGKVEMILYRKTGQKAWFLINVRLIEDMEGNLIFFLLLFNDITHTKAKIHDTPIRTWKRATRKILKKTDADFKFIFKDNTGNEQVEAASKVKKKKKADPGTISQKIEKLFIPKYGAEEIQVPKFVILHTKRWKSVWDIWVLVCILYTCCIVPFVICFDYKGDILVIFDTLVDLNFLIDVTLTLFTTYVDNKGEIVTNPKLIRMVYLKSWFAIDLVAALPYSLFEFIPGLSGQGIIEALRALKITRLVRLGKVKTKLNRYRQMKTFVLGLWILFFSLIGHWMACIWYIIAAKFDDPFKTDHGWLRMLADLTNQSYKFYINGTIVHGSGPSTASLYISALYYCLSSLTTCGFGNIAPNTSAEKTFGCVTMMLGCLLYAFIFGQVTNIISQIQKSSNEYSEQLENIKQFNKIYKVPATVAGRLESYYKATWAVTKGTDEEEILQQVPRDLQSDLCLHIHSKIFTGNDAFAKISKSALRVLSRYMSTIRTSPGDKLVYQGEGVDTVYFIASGSLEVKNGKQLIGLIGSGDAFGKRLTADFQKEGRSLYDVESCSFGAVHCIKCDYVREALHLYPEEYFQLRSDLVLAFDITRQVKIMTKDGSLITTEVSDTIKELKEAHEVNVYSVGDEVTAVDSTANIDVLAGMSELKGELRRETERMNSKMGIVEGQMRLILKLLRRNNKVDVDPEIGSQIDELMKYGQDIDDENGQWFVADSKGWIEPPPSNKLHQTVIDLNKLKEGNEMVEMKPIASNRVQSNVTSTSSASTLPLESHGNKHDKDEKEQKTTDPKEIVNEKKEQTPNEHSVFVDEDCLETITI